MECVVIQFLPYGSSVLFDLVGFYWVLLVRSMIVPKTSISCTDGIESGNMSRMSTVEVKVISPPLSTRLLTLECLSMNPSTLLVVILEYSYCCAFLYALIKSCTVTIVLISSGLSVLQRHGN